MIKRLDRDYRDAYDHVRYKKLLHKNSQPIDSYENDHSVIFSELVLVYMSHIGNRDGMKISPFIEKIQSQLYIHLECGFQDEIGTKRDYNYMRKNQRIFHKIILERKNGWFIGHLMQTILIFVRGELLCDLGGDIIDPYNRLWRHEDEASNFELILHGTKHYRTNRPVYDLPSGVDIKFNYL